MKAKLLAVSFTALMLVSTFPASQASHIDPLVPDVPVLPRVTPSQNCAPIGLDAEILARANELAAGDPAFFQDDIGVPALCAPGPIEEWKLLINEADEILEHVRTVSTEIQRQVNWRLEGTLPVSNYPNDLIEPRTTLLNDSFDGFRTGGFGEWAVVTEKGEDPLWSIERIDGVNGTRHAYRFGDADGYEQGIHQWLVSPELDLTALKGNETAVRDLAYLRAQARGALRDICNNPQGPQGLIFAQMLVCSDEMSLTSGNTFSTPAGNVMLPELHLLVEAYEMAFDEHIMSLPVMQHGAHVDITYKLNMAPGEDGVRMWIFTGDRAPDRRTLYNTSFGAGDTWRACAYESLPARNEDEQIDDVLAGSYGNVEVLLQAEDNAQYELTCPPAHRGGQVIGPERFSPSVPGQNIGMMEVSSLKPYADGPSFPPGAKRVGFSGDVPEWITARVNLSDWMGDRIWIVFEVATKSDDRGEDVFNDPSRFSRRKDFGFQLGRVDAEGDGYHRNFRVKDTATTYTYQIPSNSFDDPETTRTTTPPGDKPVVTWVHNAGDYIENGTLTLSARYRAEGSTSYISLGSHKVNVSLRPDEVKTVTTPWGLLLTNAHPTLKEKHLYEVTATLAEITNATGTIPAQIEDPGNGTPPIADPNVTRVRPANAAGLEALGAGSLSALSLVRAATIRDVTLMRADRERGNPIQLCRSVDGVECTEHYAGPKGEPRTVLVGVRNDGNTAQNITLDLSPFLDGVGKPDIVVDGVRKIARDVLPGEVRAVTWNVIATQPGAYDLIVTPIPEVPANVEPPVVKNAERKLYVQRATGLVCLDTLEERECGPSFSGDLVPQLRNEDITAAALAEDGTLFVATRVREANEEIHSGQLAARDANGVWQVLANISATRLNESLQAAPREGFAYGRINAIVPAPDGNVYLVGNNDTILRYSPTAAAPIKRLTLNATLPTDLRAAIWYKGTLLAAGENGVIARLENDTLEPFTVTNTSYAPPTSQRAFEGNFTSLVIAPTGAAMAAGEDGVILRHTPSAAITTGWSEARMSGSFGSKLVSDTLGNGTWISTLGVHDGHVLAGGYEFLYASTFNSTTGWAPISLPTPQPEFEPRFVRSVAGTSDGRLSVLVGDDLSSCTGCYPRAIDSRVPADAPLPVWESTLPLRPSVEGKGPVHPARPDMILTGDAGSLLLGEAGMVLDLRDEGRYDNFLGWSVLPKLAPRDGGVLQTRRGANYQLGEVTVLPQAILLVPDDAGREAAQSASRYRFFLNHSMNWSGDEGSGVMIRLVYRYYPAYGYELPAGQQTVYTCGSGGVNGVGLPAVCNATREHVATFTRPSNRDGWEFFVKELPNAAAFPVQNPIPGEDPLGLWFWGLEIVNTAGIRYAIDDVRLQGLVGSTWTDVVAWYGPQKQARGEWYVQDIYNTAFSLTDGPPPSADIPQPLWIVPPSGRTTDEYFVKLIGTQEPNIQWEEWDRAPFDLAVESPWHISTDYADRPVFAANNEQYKPGLSNPSAPRLMSNWDARLVSPVIDLADAYDPVITWRHLYSFRTQVARTDTADTVYPGDGGFVEVQYTMVGDECGPGSEPDATCWSRFYPVRVDEGYPNRSVVGFADIPQGGYRDYCKDPYQPQIFALPPVKCRIGNERSYWGSIAQPDATGRIQDTRLTEKYVPASITLEQGKGLCTASEIGKLAPNKARIDCLPHNVTGRQIRVAFHLMTAGDWKHNPANEAFHNEGIYNESNDPDTQRSFPGEGWYITDFRVLGAENLGIDLRATNMTFNVGYDVANIGVGPGTRVPVNVTVENHGVFNALGYTGELEVRRVVDRAAKQTELVERITLPQQPVLDAGKSINHTIFWNVPSAEGDEYVLTFLVEPIGIDRDEDHLDNVASLGSTALPVPAKTVRRFNVEFLVSPENATSDITRYVPMFINNTGNVPLDGFEVERRITVLGRSVQGDAQTCAAWLERLAGGLQTAIVDCRQWTTQRPAPAGTLTPLTILSDEVNPTNDLFWKAPERATFLVSLKGETESGGTPIVSTAEKRVAAFATYLFDDIEGGARGEAKSGEWIYGPAWNTTQPGFRSTDAYAFGDAALDRFPADTDSSLVFPTVDLGSARTAQLAFYGNFAFEPGFDGAIIEASDDNGASWSRLTPLADAIKSASYNTTEGLHVQPSSALHPSGNPEEVAYAFTSDSRKLPSNVDGWVLSLTDLTNYANVTEPDVEYEAYHAFAMSRYSVPPIEPKVSNIYYAADWCPGSPSEGRCWESQNLTEGTVTAPTAAPGEEDNTFWWSGSAARYDDHMRPIQNHLLEFTVDTSSVQPEQTVVADWWEYGARYNMRSIYLDTADVSTGNILTAPGIYTAHTFRAGVQSDNYRFNLGEPKIVETRGKWYHMQADITNVVERAGDSLTVGFAYTPIKGYSRLMTCTETACTFTGSIDAASNLTDASVETDYTQSDIDDRGIAIDGFKIEAYRVTRGAPGERTTLIDEDDISPKLEAREQGLVWECGVGAISGRPTTTPQWQGSSSFIGCANENAHIIRRAPVTMEPGRNWALATELPGVDGAWRTVKVTDHSGKNANTPLPTGDVPHAWYSGDINNCREQDALQVREEAHCARPHSEARLVTPVFDLGRIAGDNAQLSFWHRFAFYQREVSRTPLASGGVVEISALDAQTGKWEDWKQIYSTDDFRVGHTSAPMRSSMRGGYTGFTANFSSTTEGPRRFDPPFDNVIPEDSDRTDAVQFLYTGNSKTIETALPEPLRDGLPDGWLREEYDVTEFLGRKVRFGFHYAYSPAINSSQLAPAFQLANPDGNGDRTGWWISDVAVIGDVLVGKPIQLRVRAATDGNVQDGHLLLDDIGVFGARYRNNVGIFVDGSNDRYGAMTNTITTVPVTIRNLGDTVRRDLALEVRTSGGAVIVSGTGPEGNVTLDDAFFLKGFTLGPGQSAVANVKVHTPKTFSGNATLVFQLREANPQSQLRPFGPITDNEVQGLLTRYVPFRIQRFGELEWNAPLSGIRQATPQVGQQVDFVLAARNPGHGAIALGATCTARTIIEYTDSDHSAGGDAEAPIVAAAYPCEIVGNMDLAPKQWTNLTFRASPTQRGFLAFDVVLKLVQADGNVTEYKIPTAGVPVGVPIVTYRQTFDTRESIDTFTGSGPGMQWSHTRGHGQPGSLVVGINETQALAGANYALDGCGNAACFATTPPIDLHNYSSTTPAYLSFYHLDRMARKDGAQVRVEMLENELSPTRAQSWSKACVLTPINGYDGGVEQTPPVPADGSVGSSGLPGDPNPAFGTPPYSPTASFTDPDFFTNGGLWEEVWSLAVFKLPPTCLSADGEEPVKLLGRTVRFSFWMFPGAPNLEERRGNGHGFLVDEISVGPLALDVRPYAAQRATLLDNTTKGFNVRLQNLGTMPDIITLEYDAANSSAPEGSVRVPTERYTLMPGEIRTATVHVTLPRDPSLLPTEFRARILAHSVLDPNAAGSTRLELNFGPREWAELAVSVEAPKGIVQEATETFIPVTIENSGLVDSVLTRVRIVDEWAGGRIEHSLDLPSMPSYAQSADEALRVLEFRWRPERGSIGPHTLTFEIDPEIRGEEYTRSNNLVSIVVPVSDLLIPDLHIANFSALTLRNAIGGTVSPGLDADVARYEVTAGEVVSFELKVANKGRAGATNVEVRSFIGALSLPPKTIPYIAPGTEAVVTFNWLAQKGEHEIEFIVRNEQVELTPTNNRYPGTGVTLLTVKGYEVVVEIPAITDILAPASERLVPFRITNNGNAGEDLELRVKTPAGMRLMLPREGFFLRAGETYADNARLILAAEAVAGQQFISIDAIARENPMKVATGRAALGVLASYGGSVAGGYATGAPPELTIPVELVNEGNSLEPWKLTLSLPAGWTSKESQPARVVVPAHDRATFEFHVTLPQGTAPGDRVIAVKAEMPNGEKREGVARVGVLPLRAASVSVQEGAGAPQKGELVVPIRVQNTGNVREPFSLLLVDPPAGVEMRVEPAEFLLPPGGVVEATLMIKPNASIDAGTYAIVGYTRFEGVVPQTREGLANVQTLRVPIVRQDLRVTSLEFSPRAEIDAGDRVTVRVSVQNFGHAAVANVPVHLFVDDVFAGEVLVASVPAGARSDVTFNWTAVNGVHTLTAVVDPYEDTVDSGREDNAVSTLATVGTSAENGGIAAGRADAPMGGLWIVVAALLVGMVTRKFGSWRRERR